MENAWNQFKDWCLSFYQYITTHVPVEVMIYIGIAILILILVGIISRMMKKRRVQKRLSELEVEVNEIRENTLEYKFSKATAFAKANEDLTERVDALKPRYDICIQSVQACENLYEKAYGYMQRHKYKKAMRTMDEVETVLEDTDERIRIVTQSLDNILSREAEVQAKSEALRKRYETIRKKYEDSRDSFGSAADYLDALIASTDSLFTSLDEKMDAAEFNKAVDEIEHLSKRLDEFEQYMEVYPRLMHRCSQELPAAIEEVKAAAQQMQQEKIDTTYLGVDDKIDAISNALEDAMLKLDSGNLQAAAPAIDDITDQVLALQDDIVSEHEAFREIQSNLETNFAVVDQVEEELAEITRLYASIKDRFGLEDWTRRFVKAREEMELLKQQRDDIQKSLAQSDTLQVDVVSGYRAFSLKIEAFGKEVSDMKQLLVGASSDESRAQKQLTKLELILNEVRLNTSTKQLPAISSQFDEDVRTGEEKIAAVREILSSTPLKIDALNSTLQDAIDFIYKLYSNATNLVGVAVMVENAIVFGNRFRSSYPALDSDLSKAELYFQNGEYTRALKTAMTAIETLHPGIYQKLVARKDPAVMNQA